MAFDSEIRHRRSLRLPHYDYSRPGAYFVTVCAYKRELYFEDSRLAGVAREIWDLIPVHHPTVDTDEFIVMPNHVHGILWLTDECRGRIYPARNRKGAIYGAPTPLSVVIQNYKAAVTRRIRRATHTYFAWQRNYYERVIRNEAELTRIRQYIRNNPLNRESDEENPGKATTGLVRPR